MITRLKALPRWAKIVLPIAAALTLCICGTVSLDLILPDPTPTEVAAEPTSTPGPTDTLPPPTEILPTATDTLPPPTHTPTPTHTSPPPTETNTPGPSPTPRPTIPPEPTKTPRPSNTPTPTNTPVPTNTPAPTSTPQPTQPPRANVVISYVYNDGYEEHVTIENQGDAPADMSGWTVSGSKGEETYHFPGGYTLSAGASMRLYSGENGIDMPPSDIWWTEKTVWNNSGETVSLKDASGNLVDAYSW